MPRVVAIIQARMSSTRLPGKVLAPIDGMPAILYMATRARRARTLDDVVVATSVHPSDDPLAEAVGAAGMRAFRGDLDDVLARYALAAEATAAEVIVRLTGDCPLIDPAIIDRVVAALVDAGADYASNVDPPTWADGLDVEAFTADALSRAWRDAPPGPAREHVTTWMREEATGLRRVAVRGVVDSSHLRLTIDHPEDLASVRRLVDAMAADRGGDASAPFDHYDMLRCIERHPGLLSNTDIQRNEKLAVGESVRPEADNKGP